MNVLKDRWVTDRFLTLKEREILFITAQSCGLKIYPETATHINAKTYGRIYINHHGELSGCSDNFVRTKKIIEVSYQELLKQLRSHIKKQINDKKNV